MLTSEFKPWHVPIFLAKYAYLTMRRRPVLVHFEVTMRCNAHCGFCDYWKTDPAAKESELKSFAACASFFNPMLITFTGGEPTLRRDLEDLVSSVNRAVNLKYITLITHGGMLSPERARSLWKAGVNQFNISLDFLDERHDRANADGAARAGGERAARIQEEDAGRDHQLRLLPRADPTLRAR